MLTTEAQRAKLCERGWKLRVFPDGAEHWDLTKEDDWYASITLQPHGEHWCDYSGLAYVLEFLSIVGCEGYTVRPVS